MLPIHLKSSTSCQERLVMICTTSLGEKDKKDECFRKHIWDKRHAGTSVSHCGFEKGSQNRCWVVTHREIYNARTRVYEHAINVASSNSISGLAPKVRWWNSDLLTTCWRAMVPLRSWRRVRAIKALETPNVASWVCESCHVTLKNICKDELLHILHYRRVWGYGYFNFTVLHHVLPHMRLLGKTFAQKLYPQSRSLPGHNAGQRAGQPPSQAIRRRSQVISCSRDVKAEFWQ